MIWFGLTALIFLFIGFLILYRLPVCSAKEEFSPSIPEISLIIPARNEERNLPRLLGSIKTQTIMPDEIIVVDDNSEDATARIAEEYGAKVITSSGLPKGWLGKPWSCYQGSRKANGDIFIFLDADTFLESDGLKRMMQTFISGSGVVSIFPYHKIQRLHEVFSAFFNLMQLIGMHHFSLSKGRQPKGMFGPCLIISREDYMDSGGHKAVRGEVLEHYTLADILRNHRIPIRLFSGKGTLNVRMYSEGWKELIQGWTKSFTLGAGQTPPIMMRLSVMWISGLLITPVFLLFSFFSHSTLGILFWSIIYILYIFQLFIQFLKVGNFPLWSVVLYPVILIFFLAVFIWALYRNIGDRQISWKGRNIH
jgi:4,4'-diaponeurosporenoate glycosyltransferase